MNMKKYVLTGGPSSGKTSLLEELGRRGFYAIREAAKDFIIQKQQEGIKEPRLKKDFQEKILDIQLKREAEIPPDKEVVFIDRGLPDGLAFYMHRKQKPLQRLLESIAKCEYEKIFFLEPLHLYEGTGFRTESEEESQNISNLLKRLYEDFGYEVVMVPPVSIKERAEFVLKRI